MPIVESFNTSNSVSGNIQYLFDQKDKEVGAIDILDALKGGSEKLYEKATQIDHKLSLILGEMKMVNTHLATSDANKMFSEGIDHSAILAVELDATGDAKSFMGSLERLAQLDDIKLLYVSNGLDSIGMSIDKIVNKDYSKFEPIVSSLETFSKGLVNFTQSLPSFKQIASIAGGVALLGLSIAGFAGGIGLDDVIAMGITFTVISVASRMLKGTKNNLLRASFGVATLGLSVWAFNKVVDSTEVLSFSTTLLTLGGAVWAFDKAFSKASFRTGKSIQALSLGVGALGVGMLGFNWVEWESIGKGIASIAGIGLVASGLSALKTDSPPKLLALAGAVGILGISLATYKNISYSDVGVALLAVGGTAIASKAFSKMGTNGLIGAGVLGAMGLSMVALAYGLDKMNNIGLTWESAGVIATTLGLTAAAFAGLGAVSVLVGLGAIVAIGMGAALATLSYALNSVSSVNVTPEQAGTFAASVMNIKDAIVGIGNPLQLPSLLAGIATSALITGATIPLVLASNMVSRVSNPSKEQLLGFSNTIDSLKNTFTQFGFLDLAELAAVTPIMLLMATTTVALGGAINLFTKLSTSPNVAQGAVDTLDTFLGGLNTTYSKYDDNAFTNLKKGIDATMRLGDLLSNLSIGISSISEHITSNTDFDKIGEGVSSMLVALTDPLKTIGSSNKKITAFGKEFSIPFTNEVQGGVEALSGLGDIFTPLVDMLNAVTKDTDATLVTTFSTNIKGIVGVLKEVFKNFSLAEDDTQLDMFFKATDKASSFVKTLTGSNYEPAQKGLMSISKSTREMQVAVNDMDLTKLTKLNDLFVNLNQLDESDGVQAILDALGQLIKAMEETTSNIENNQSNDTVINNAPNNGVVETNSKDNKSDDIDIASLISKSNGDVVKVMEELTRFMKSGQLKVTSKTQAII